MKIVFSRNTKPSIIHHWVKVFKFVFKWRFAFICFHLKVIFTTTIGQILTWLGSKHSYIRLFNLIQMKGSTLFEERLVAKNIADIHDFHQNHLTNVNKHVTKYARLFVIEDLRSYTKMPSAVFGWNWNLECYPPLEMGVALHLNKCESTVSMTVSMTIIYRLVELKINLSNTDW